MAAKKKTAGNDLGGFLIFVFRQSYWITTTLVALPGRTRL